MVENETLEGGPKGWEKEELREEEWVSLNTLSLKKTNIWQDQYMTRLLNFLELKRGEERGFLCLGVKEMGVYIIVVKEIWMESHLIRVDKESWTQASF